MVSKIVSGGQTGADLAALDFAIESGLEHGGWIPKGRLTEDGPLDGKYLLREMETDSYPKRTEKNVLESDATLVVSRGELGSGTELTVKMAKKHCKPFLHIDLDKMSMVYAVRMTKMWLVDNGIKCLNVAGPRASRDPEIYSLVYKLLKKVL